MKFQVSIALFAMAMFFVSAQAAEQPKLSSQSATPSAAGNRNRRGLYASPYVAAPYPHAASPYPYAASPYVVSPYAATSYATSRFVSSPYVAPYHPNGAVSSYPYVAKTYASPYIYYP